MDILVCSNVSEETKSNSVSDTPVFRVAPSDEELHEIVEKGKALYEKYKQELEGSNQGKFASIDVDRIECAVADSPVVAAKILLQKYPDARLYGARIGHEAMFTL